MTTYIIFAYFVTAISTSVRLPCAEERYCSHEDTRSNYTTCMYIFTNFLNGKLYQIHKFDHKKNYALAARACPFAGACFSRAARSVLCSGRQFFGILFGIIFGVSPGISFGIFVPLAFSFAQISSPHICFHTLTELDWITATSNFAEC